MARIRYALLFLTALLLLNACNPAANTKKNGVIKGILDLQSSLPFEKDGPINLDGDWEFYWNEFLEPASSAETEKHTLPADNQNLRISQYMHVPSQWQKQGFPEHGFATYRLRILLPADPEILSHLKEQGLSLFLSGIGANHSLYINGKLISQNGTAGRTKEESSPLIKNKTVPLKLNELLAGGNTVLDIIIHISNFHDIIAGIWNPIQLGYTRDLAKAETNKLVLDLIVFSSLFIMGIYHLELFTSRRKEKSPLYFGLFCLVIALRTVSINEKMILDAFPFLSFFTVHKLEYLSFYFGVLTFIWFLRSLFPEEFSSRWNRAFTYSLIPCLSAVILLPMNWYPKTLTFVQLLTVVALIYSIKATTTAFFHKRFGARLFLIGFTLFAITVTHDILKSRGILQTPHITSYGLLVFIIFQSAILSGRFAGAFNDLEKLSEELKKSFEIIKETEEQYRTLIGNLNVGIYRNSGNSKGKFLQANPMIAKMFGYDSVEEFMTVNTLDLYADIEERNKFSSIIKQKGECKDLEIKMRRKDGSLFFAAINAKAKYDDSGNILWLDGVIDDITDLKFATEELIELSESLETKVIERTKDLEEAKSEIEELNRFTHMVNSLTSLDEIFVETSKYIYNKYGIAVTWLSLPDPSKEYLYTYRIYSYKKFSEERYNYAMNMKIPIQKIEDGILFRVFHRMRTFYLNKTFRFEDTIDKAILKDFSIYSTLYVPLVRKNESVGIFGFSNLEDAMPLSKKEIRKISNLCSQIAGAVDTNYLLQQVDKARKETEKQKEETEALNELIKSLNEDLNLKNIMDKVIGFVNKNYGIQYHALYSINSKKTHINLIDVSFPDYIIEEDRETIVNFSIPIQNVIGANALAIKAKKLFYFEKLRKKGITKEELFIIEKYKMQSYLTMPLLLNNEPIAILSFSNSLEPMKLSKQDITKLSILGEQLAGIIYGSNLFKEVQEARNQAEIEKGIALLAQKEAEDERQKSENLLLNILPKDIALELKEKGFSEPVHFDSVSVLFTDFKGFTQIAETLSPNELVKELDACFVQFDKVTERFKLEKLKTIGDSYMCAGGIPKINSTHAIDCVLAALEIQSFMNIMKSLKAELGIPYWELRLGIHSGPLVAGVIGEKKFAYDVWGDTVNTASRMESSGTPGMINISGVTYELVKEFFACEYRGKVKAKNKGEVDMYYVHGLKPEFSKDGDGKTPGFVPNEKFWEMYD